MKEKNELTAEEIKNDQNNNDDQADATMQSEATCEVKLEALQKENAQLREQRLLALANLDNTRKMFERELQENRQYFLQNLAKELLPILDHFAIAFNVKNISDDVKQFLKGFEMTYKMLQDILASYGVKTIPVQIGDQFDSYCHQATSQIETTAFSPDTIVKVLRQGYKLYDRVLRPTEVMIAKAPNNDVVAEQDDATKHKDKDIKIETDIIEEGDIE